MDENEVTSAILDAAFRIHRELGPGLLMKECFRADLIIEDKVLVELKSVERWNPIHKKQVITYLKITGLNLGILINFEATVNREGIERIAHGL